MSIWEQPIRATRFQGRSGHARGMAWHDDEIAGFTTALLDEWERVPPDRREVWLRQRINDLFERLRTIEDHP